ncbi:MAG: glycoside hydrolase family 25 protein [Alphaproteobacteria bacterium]|nr:glycoside hydrolase family 25 protein [Alphaproteobacteria bacterium]
MGRPRVSLLRFTRPVPFGAVRKGWRAVALAVAGTAALLLAGCGGGGPGLEMFEGEGGRAGAGNEHFTGLHPNQFQIHGIDVSRWQGDIDWHAVRRSGVKFAWIKATEGGDHLDPKFRQNWDGAKAAGVPRGAYHFVFWCRTAEEQMNWMFRNVPVDRNALPPVLDVEHTPTSKNCRRKLNREEILPKIRTMLAMMERHYGKRPVIYVTVDFYRDMFMPNELPNYDFWVRSTKYEPQVHYPGRKWVFWQYQSDGAAPGIKGKIDKNVFHGTREQWRAWLNGRRGR